MDQERFYGLLAGADQFDLVSFEERWFQEHAARACDRSRASLAILGESQALCDKGALPLHYGEQADGRV